MGLSKTEIQIQFDEVVSEVVWPKFKERGYKKAGNNFRSFNPAGWGKILNIQKSAYGSRDDISFTLNTGLYLPKADELWTGRAANERFLELDCLIRKRIGHLKGLNDMWYELVPQSESNKLFQRVEQDLDNHVLPYLDRITGVEDILRQLMQERKPNPVLAIETLFLYGKKEEAQQWMEEELATTIYRTHRQKMLELQARLTLGN